MVQAAHCANKVFWNIVHSKSQPLRTSRKKPVKTLPRVSRKNCGSKSTGQNGTLIDIICRIRPSTQFDQKAVVIDDKEKLIRIVQPHRAHRDPSAAPEVTFRGIKCLYGGTQQQVYEDSVKRHFTNTLDGFSSVMLLCGTSNTGKTFSAVGEENFRFRGIIPRGIQDLFNEIRNRDHDYDVSVSMSCFDMVGNSVLDLLAMKAVRNMTIRNYHKINFVKDVSYTRVKDEEEALFAFYTAVYNRKRFGRRFRNGPPLEYHSVYSFFVQTESTLLTVPVFKVAKISIIRLGSFTHLQQEPYVSYEKHGILLDMNKTLGHLQQVVKSKGESSKSAHFVSCRQTRLAHLMKDVLAEKSARICVVACVSGDPAFLGDCVSTLKFASRLSGLAASSKENSIADPKKALTFLKEQAEMLKMELRMYDLLNGREAPDYALKPKTRDLFHTARDVKNFIEGRSAIPKFATYKQLEEFLNLLKKFIKEGDIPTDPPDGLDLSSTRDTTQFGTMETDQDGKQSSPPKELMDFDGMGDLDEREGTGAGTPGNNAKSKNLKNLMKKKKDDKKEDKAKPEKMSVVTPKKNGKDNTSGKKKEREPSKETNAVSPLKDIPAEAQRRVETGVKTDQKADSGAESPKLDSPVDIQQGVTGRITTEPAANTLTSGDHGSNSLPKCCTKSGAYETFVHLVPNGIFLNSEVAKLRENVVRSEKRATTLVTAVNARIDELTAAESAYSHQRADRNLYSPENTGEIPVVSLEEFKNNKKIKYLRSLIETGYKDIEIAKAQLGVLRENLDDCRKKMLFDFEDWFSRSYDNTSDQASDTYAADLGALPAKAAIAGLKNNTTTGARENENSQFEPEKLLRSKDLDGQQIFYLRDHPFSSALERHKQELPQPDEQDPDAVVFNRVLTKVRTLIAIRQQSENTAEQSNKPKLDPTLRIGGMTSNLASTLSRTI